MTIFRWIIGVLAALFTTGWLFCLLLYVLQGDDRYGELGKRMGRFVLTVLLFWFDIEVWGRVIWTLITWH